MLLLKNGKSTSCFVRDGIVVRKKGKMAVAEAGLMADEKLLKTLGPESKSS
jgi:hypothetical protein